MKEVVVLAVVVLTGCYDTLQDVRVNHLDEKIAELQRDLFEARLLAGFTARRVAISCDIQYPSQSLYESAQKSLVTSGLCPRDSAAMRAQPTNR